MPPVPKTPKVECWHCFTTIPTARGAKKRGWKKDQGDRWMCKDCIDREREFYSE